MVDVLDPELVLSYWGQQVDDPTLVMHWALDEAQGTIAYDRAGQNDASLVGGPVWQPDADKIDGAIQLDGVDDVIIAGATLNLPPGLRSVSKGSGRDYPR